MGRSAAKRAARERLNLDAEVLRARNAEAEERQRRSSPKPRRLAPTGGVAKMTTAQAVARAVEAAAPRHSSGSRTTDSNAKREGSSDRTASSASAHNLLLAFVHPSP